MREGEAFTNGKNAQRVLRPIGTISNEYEIPPFCQKEAWIETIGMDLFPIYHHRWFFSSCTSTLKQYQINDFNIAFIITEEIYVLRNGQVV